MAEPARQKADGQDRATEAGLSWGIGCENGQAGAVGDLGDPAPVVCGHGLAERAMGL